MKVSKRAKLFLLCTIFAGFSIPLTSCAARPKQANILSDQTLNKNSTAFILALFKQDNTAVVNLTSYPFYLNHQGLVNNEEEWTYILGQSTNDTQAAEVSILSLEAFPAERLRTEKPALWAKIFEYQFDQKFYILAKLLINQEQQENVLLFMDPGSGKVSGFVR